jgi:hypothetical protein
MESQPVTQVMGVSGLRPQRVQGRALGKKKPR